MFTMTNLIIGFFLFVVFLYTVVTSFLLVEKKEVIVGKVISIRESHGRLGLPEDPDATNDMYYLILFVVNGARMRFSLPESLYKKLETIPNLLGGQIKLTLQGEKILDYKVERLSTS